MRALVVTIVHRPDDARILHRQIAALVQAGHQVTYAAPFGAYAVPRPEGISTIDLPRATGRERGRAIRAARDLLRRQAPLHDVVLLHDPELLIATVGLRLPCVVWDVHEDTAAATSSKGWVPAPAAPLVARGVRLAERLAERSVHLLLAEHGYRDRFAADHLVVPNSTWLPESVSPSQPGRAVYVGALTRVRGALDLVATGERLEGTGITLHVVGHADGETSGPLQAAHDAGALHWHGFLPNDQALAILEGATAGLSLLHDEPNYRHSQPTKIIEYMSRGIPVVTTPLPPAQRLVQESGAGVVVPFQDSAAVAAAIVALNQDDAGRAAMAAAGRAVALRDYDWRADAQRFVAQLETWSVPT